MSKEIIRPETGPQESIIKRAAAAGMLVLSLAGCTFQQEQPNPAAGEPVPTIIPEVESTYPPTTETDATDYERSPEAKQTKINQQLSELFDKVYAGDVPGEFSLNISAGESYGDTRYYEASTGIGDKQLTVALEAPGSSDKPNIEKATFVMARLSNHSKGGEPSLDNPDGSVTIAEVSVIDQDGFRTETVGQGDVGQFSTRDLQGDELNAQLDSAQDALTQISKFFGEEA